MTFVRSIAVLGTLAVSSLMAMPALAQGSTEFKALEGDAGLARAATPDTTPRQRYATALREAHGARKNNLAECRSGAAAERRGCIAEAQRQFKHDMALAEQLRRDPDARPTRARGGDPRQTGRQIIIKQ